MDLDVQDSVMQGPDAPLSLKSLHIIRLNTVTPHSSMIQFYSKYKNGNCKSRNGVSRRDTGVTGLGKTVFGLEMGMEKQTGGQTKHCAATPSGSHAF